MYRLAPLIILLLACGAAHAHVLEEAWTKYSGIERAAAAAQQARFPGELLGLSNANDESAFDYPWKYRSSTYEMHFANPEQLARGVYGLALHAGDITNAITREKFYSGVLGFHYSGAQIASWLNSCLARHESLDADENIFAGKMLAEGIIRIGKNGFEAAGPIHHVLGAAPGKKRTFDANLRHERLHVFWDEDAAFREREQKAWQMLTPAEREEAKSALANYAQDNEAQLVEEWAIKRAENSRMGIK